jgi:hypothetical protein
MANLNVSSTSSFVSLSISSTDNRAITYVGGYPSTATWTASTTTDIVVPALQDITVTNNNGTFRWVQLDSVSRSVVATPATNSLNFNIVLDPTTFYVGQGTTPGIFNLSNQKTRIYFKFAWGGNDGSTNNTRYITGTGFLAGLAPKVTPDQPVWLSPLIIEVDGNFLPNTLA